MTDLAHYITDYGYWALFIGCPAEGETITLLGGIAAHEGLLHWPWVIAVVALGGTLGISCCTSSAAGSKAGSSRGSKGRKSASRAPEG